MFMTMLAAFKLAGPVHYSGESDIVVGVPLANRDRGDIENLIGFFVNTMPFRTDLAGCTGFQEVRHGLARPRSAPLRIRISPSRGCSRSGRTSVTQAGTRFSRSSFLSNRPPNTVHLSGLDLEMLKMSTIPRVNSTLHLFSSTTARRSPGR